MKRAGMVGFAVLSGLLVFRGMLWGQEADQRAAGEPSERAAQDFDIRRLDPRLRNDSGQGPRSRIVFPKAGPPARSVGGEAPAAARAYLGVNAPQVGDLRLLKSGVMGRATVVDFVQTFQGIPVFEGHVQVLIAPDGGVISATAPEPGLVRVEPGSALLAPEDAVNAALRTVGFDPAAPLNPVVSPSAANTFENPAGPGLGPILAELTVFRMDRAHGRLAWRVVFDLGGRRSYEVLVDAGDGRLLFRHSLVRSAGQGRVFRVAPDKADRELTAFSDQWLAVGVPQTTGNNADAYVDVNGDNAPDILPAVGIRDGRAFAENQVFDFPAPVFGSPADPRVFRAAAVTNAFYFVNTAHDFFYGLGFDEASGNFQRDNGNRGGVGGDAVRVEVHDGAETNNASMTLTMDGNAPRMQLGIFTRFTASRLDDRDFAYDGQVVVHEYTHGVAGRLVGAGTSLSCMSGVQSGAMGEGWADYFAASFFNDPVISAYTSPNRVRGIRRQSYEGYTFTYEDLGNQGFEVHRDGEIWAATLWELRQSMGRALADRIIYAALRLTPCRPSFIDGRDAILAADRAINNGFGRPQIVRVFAKHGMGASASGFDGSLASLSVFNAAFDLPPDLQPGNRAPMVTSRPTTVLASGDTLNYQIRAEDPDGGTLRFDLVEGPQGMMVDPATGVVRWTAVFTSERARVAVTDGQGGRVIHGIYVLVVTPLRTGVPLSITSSRTEGLATIQVPVETKVLQVTLRGGRGDADVIVIGPTGFVDREFRSGLFETLSVPLPAPGDWIISVLPFMPFEGVQLTASLIEPRLISGNTTVPGLSGEISSESFFRVIVPPGANNLQITVNGGSGDVDVAVNRESPPSCQSYDDIFAFRCILTATHGSFNIGNNESITVGSPQAGNWYIDLTGVATYGGATLTTRMDVRPTLVVSSNTLAFNVLEGAAAPAAQMVKITNPAGTAFSWTATVSQNAPWLRVDKTSGTGEGDLAVSVNLQGLAPGTHTGTINVAAGGLSFSPQIVTVTLNLTRRPVISGAAALLNFMSAPGENPAVQRLGFNNTGGGTLEWTVTIQTASGGAWLSVDQLRGTGNNVNLQVIVQALQLGPGTYDGTLTITARDAVNVVVRVRYAVVIPLLVTEQSLQSVATMRAGFPLSPGEMTLLRGANFTDPCSTEAGAPNPCPRGDTYPLPIELRGVRVTVNQTAAPLLLLTPTEIRFVAPFGLEGAEAMVSVTRQGVTAPPVVRQLVAQSPGIFTVLDNGAGAARMFHADGTLVSRGTPLLADEMVSVLTGGLGGVDPAVATGAAPPADPKAAVLGPVKVYFDGAEGAVAAAYLEPGMAGVYRIEVKAPAGFGSKFPSLVVEGSGLQSNEASAGGLSLLDVQPATVSRGTDASVTLRGVNLPEGAAIRIGEQTIAGGLTDGPLQSLQVTIPAALLEGVAELVLRAVNPGAADEPASNPVALRVR